MKIQIDGVGTHNKGAELMLYAVLQQIEKRYSNAKVLCNRIGLDVSYIQTSLDFQTSLGLETYYLAKKLISLCYKCRIPGILKRLSIHSALFADKHIVKNVDIVLDAGGFQFSDEWKTSNAELSLLKQYYKGLKKEGTKIVLLPQAFGPFNTKNGKQTVEIISQYADMIFARDKVSYDYLIEAGADEKKIHLYPDFTALVQGIIPEQYESLRDAVCVVPNMKMISKGVVSQEQYILLLSQIIKAIREKGKEVFLLNHEGKKDAKLCHLVNEKMSNSLIVADNLTALEVKGLIAHSHLLISSRYHGIANALNSAVPCLATSWSHKYEELFKDYGLSGSLLDLTAIEKAVEKVSDYLTEQKCTEISSHLKQAKLSVVEKNEKMWNMVFEIS